MNDKKKYLYRNFLKGSILVKVGRDIFWTSKHNNLSYDIAPELEFFLLSYIVDGYV